MFLHLPIKINWSTRMLTSNLNKPSFEKEERLVSLDLVRGIAAFSVCISHFFIWNHFNNPYIEQISLIGVEIFFVLSGYVLAPQIYKCVSGASFTQTFRVFLIRRWYRTIPPYLVALICMAFITGPIDIAVFFEFFLYIFNFFDIDESKNFFTVSWSLAVEEWFYVFFPIFLVLCKKTTDISIIKISIIYILIFIIAKIVLFDPSSTNEQMRRIVIFRLDSIAVGFILYFLYDELNELIRNIISPIILVLSFVFLALIPESINNEIYVMSIGPLFAVSFLITSLNLENILSHSLRKISNFLGKISYSVYLFHGVFLSIMVSYDIYVINAATLVIFIIFLSFFCWHFYQNFEVPILNKRPNYMKD